MICDNIARFGATERGLLSQNILGHIRNFVEYVAIKAFSNGADVNPNDYNLNVAALKDMQRHGNLRFLYRFHELLQKSVSHYTVDKDGSERLMLKYYEHLFKTKLYLKQAYNLDVLENIEDFPLDTDTELSDYYTKIAERIETPSRFSYAVTYNDRYYVQKIKPFFINQRIYYEVTFTAATANTSKFDRVIAFTSHEIMDNYAIKFSIYNDTIHILDKDMSILIIDGYEVSIRPCEWDNLSEIFGPRVEHSTNSIEYRELMRFLSTVKMPLTELVSSDQDYYNFIKSHITSQAKSIKIYELLDQCREVIVNGKAGSNVLRYLLYKMNNRVTDSNLNHTGIYLYSKGKIMIHLTFDYKTDEKCTTPGQYLKYHRTFQGLSTRELAEKVGIVPATLVLYENNRHPIKYSTAVALANVLGIDRNRLLDKYTAFVDYPYSSLLKKVRQELSLTQMQMAEVIGIGQTSYSGWEREIRVPRRKEYEKILAALKKLKVNVDTYLCQSTSI